MTRQNKNKPSVADAFARSAKTQVEESAVETVQETAQDAPQVTETTSIEGIPTDSPLTVEELARSITATYDERSKKKTVEETHTRTTFLLENTLLQRLNKLSKGKKGYKTLILNQAVKAMLDQLDKK